MRRLEDVEGAGAEESLHRGSVVRKERSASLPSADISVTSYIILPSLTLLMSLGIFFRLLRT